MQWDLYRVWCYGLCREKKLSSTLKGPWLGPEIKLTKTDEQEKKHPDLFHVIVCDTRAFIRKRNPEETVQPKCMYARFEKWAVV